MKTDTEKELRRINQYLVTSQVSVYGAELTQKPLRPCSMPPEKGMAQHFFLFILYREDGRTMKSCNIVCSHG